MTTQERDYLGKIASPTHINPNMEPIDPTLEEIPADPIFEEDSENIQLEKPATVIPKKIPVRVTVPMKVNPEPVMPKKIEPQKHVLPIVESLPKQV